MTGVRVQLNHADFQSGTKDFKAFKRTVELARNLGTSKTREVGNQAT
ncbi:hypothetical protein [Nitrospira sp. M1]